MSGYKLWCITIIVVPYCLLLSFGATEVHIDVTYGCKLYVFFF
jgi:hypothetical protein